jgi:ABC-type phosphate transport system substrate-binding protein
VDAQLVRGAGGEIGLNAYVQWGEGYNYVTDQILYTFNVIYNVSQGIEAYENDQLDFFAIDEPRAYDPNYVQVPLLAGGIALSYFLPTLATGTPALNLSREALAGIWLGQVTSWNDSEISGLNPNAALPNTPIILTYLPLRGVTKAFVRGLASFIADSDPVIAAALRANETLAYLPPALNGNALPFNSTDLAMAYMFANPGTLMYVVNDGFYTPYLPAIAHLRNRARTCILLRTS